MRNEQDRDAYRTISEVRSSGVFGDRRETCLIPRGRGDRNSGVDYLIKLYFDIPSRFPDALTEGMLYTTLYCFLSSIIWELAKLPNLLNLVLFLIFLFAIFPLFIAIYAICRHPELFFGVLFRVIFICTGILFGLSS